jgi:C4-dicarboxylate transporter DctQ subunit
MTENPPGASQPGRLPRTVFVTIPRMLMALLILAGIAINFANVVARYLFDFAIFWAEEIMVFIIIWCVFIGAITVTYNGAHLRMDLLATRLSGRWKSIINGLTAVAFLVLGVFMIPQSFEVVSFLGNANQVSVTASVPKEIPHSAILVGFVFMVLAVSVRLRSYLTGRF